jgi:Domain of unknown function (DUF4157)
MSGTATRTAVHATHPALQAGGDVLRRSCACGRCAKCAAKKQGNIREGLAPTSVHDVLRTPGRPLESGMRGFMEQRFGQDFSGVRVHADKGAAASAAAVEARAYTVGEQIVLGDRVRADDKHLHAHELAHVVQQRAYGRQGIGRLAALEIGRPSDPAEAEADRMAGQALRGMWVSTPALHPPALRRQTGSTGSQLTSQPTAAAQPAARPEPQLVANVNLGRMSRSSSGYADAVLHRAPATPRAGREAQPCELELFLKLHFDFHLGPSPYRQGPMGGMTQAGGPWPADRAAAWKLRYMQVAQATWYTRSTLERAGDCAGEACSRAIGHLRVVDADTMTDSSGNRVSVAGMSNSPHFYVDVYENRPFAGRDTSMVGGNHATLYDEDVLPRNAPQPQGFDETQYNWRPGAASHETGHMLGRPHVNCGPDSSGDQNRDECYGVTPDQRSNVMGRGTDVSKDDHAPFLAGMRATTGCDWHVASGLSGWAIFGIVMGSLAAAGVIAGVAAYAASHH